ncbi:MAG: hypothetical protein K5981_08480 [Clostridia bacterium]|nr:hypothetical protein [Clostridia bacterium]
MGWWNRFTAIFRKKLKETDGSVIVDAALCIPVFCVALALLLGLVRQTAYEESLAYGAAMAAETVTRAGIAIQIGRPLAEDDAGRLLLSGGEWALFSWKAADAASGGSRDPKARTSLFLTDQEASLRSGRRVDGLVRASVHAEERIRLPLLDPFWPGPQRSVLFRPWRGESHQADASDERVYVFPHYGERYHAAGCRILRQGSVEEILTASLKRRYRPCKICHPEKLSFGSIVFLFSDGSSVYHRKECASITKYYVSMPLSEAESEGYTPCAYCRGGN